MAYHRAFDRRDYLQVRRFYDNRSVEELANVVRAYTDVEYEARIKQSETFLRKAFEILSEKQQLTLSLFFFVTLHAPRNQPTFAGIAGQHASPLLSRPETPKGGPRRHHTSADAKEAAACSSGS